MTSKRIVNVYLGANGMFTLAASLIWAVNTLFLLAAGLDIFEVMVANAAFTAGQILFEVPTGVLADTIGRKASFLIGIAALFVATILYVLAADLALGLPMFVFASVLIGFGFTCQTGAMDAWLVDALAYAGYDRPMEAVFARGQLVFGVATLAGTIVGGVLGQADLSLPYYGRAAALLVAFGFVTIAMREVGFEPRPLVLGRIGQEGRAVLVAGIDHGWKHPVVRLLFLTSLAQGAFFIFGFYSWQRYFLDLLGRDLIWVNGLVTAGFASAGILGNMLVGRVMGRRDGVRRSPANVLALAAIAGAVLVIGVGLVGVVLPAGSRGAAPFAVAVGLYLAFSVVSGVAGPVRQAYINRQIPAAQRATVLSLDALFADAGASAGQLGLGWLSRAVSIPVAWLVGGAITAIAAPLYRASGRAEGQSDTAEGSTPEESDESGPTERGLPV